MTHPGDRLRALAFRFCDERTMERVINPAVADLQKEGPSWRGYLALIKVVAICIVGGNVLGLQSWTTEDRRQVLRTLLWSTALIVACTALFELPSALWDGPRILLHPSPLRYVYLAPRFMVVTLTIGLTLGLVFALGGRSMSRQMAVAVLAGSLAASAMTFVNTGWITPWSDHAFHVLMYGSPDDGGALPEKTLADVGRKLDVLKADPALTRNGYFQALAYSYHARVAIAFSPVVYAIFALSLFGTIRRRWLLAVIVCLSFAGYQTLVNRLLPWNSGLPTVLAAWTPNLFVLASAAAVAGLSARRRTTAS